MRFRLPQLPPYARELVAEMRRWWRTVYLGPFVVGIAIIYVLAFIPQTREVYLSIIETDNFSAGLLGILVVLFLCMLLRAWLYLLATNTIDRLYLQHADPAIDRRLQRVRNFLMGTCALLPLMGLAAGLALLFQEARIAREKFKAVLGELAGADWPKKFPEFADTSELLRTFPILVFVLGTLVLILIVLLLKYGKDRILSWFEKRIPYPRATVLVAMTIAVLSTCLPLLCHDCVVPATQAIGPLATGSIVLVTFVTVVMTLSVLSTIYRVPILAFCVLGFLGLAIYEISLTWKSQVASLQARESSAPSLHTRVHLQSRFQAWIDGRKAGDIDQYLQGQGRRSRYPVFILAAQGGGIYATSAAASFLASMQDSCPNFAQHVFAISAVSGGAVGAAVFNALVADHPLVQSPGCAPANGRGPLSERSKFIIRKDHLSPALAMFWPDIVRKFTPDATFDRSSVLERSFACAAMPSSSGRLCGSAGPRDNARGLTTPFDKHWSPTAAAPAMVLNTTWVEPGLRVAFAPFPLHAISDGTLYSFYRHTDGANNSFGDFELTGTILDAHRSLVEAAFVSARFPLIVPAWSIDVNIADTSSKRWNFVDGGYVDNSGSTTAAELYDALSEYIAEKELPVDLYLVLLTDAPAATKPNDVSDGTRFSDTVAPITALLNVRSQLSNRAVTRAIEQIEPSRSRERLTGRDGDSKLLIVNTTQKTFELPLGWLISRTTDDIVRLMMGRPDLCIRSRDWSAVNTQVIDAVNVIRDNSCVKSRLIDLLEGRQSVPSELSSPLPNQPPAISPPPAPPPPSWNATIEPSTPSKAGP